MSLTDLGLPLVEVGAHRAVSHGDRRGLHLLLDLRETFVGLALSRSLSTEIKEV